jgi:phosphoglycolate phosphatase
MCPLLVLFDIDGTLLLDDGMTHGRAMTEAMRTVYGVELPDDAVQMAAPWGKTDVRIAREVLRAREVPARAIDDGLREWGALVGTLFTVYAAETSSTWRTRAEMPAALQELGAEGMRLALLTGNLRGVATTKIERMDLRLFDLESSAFGDDNEDREKLAPICRSRAGTPAKPWPRNRTVVVGDTPSDIAAAHADALRSIVFVSPRYSEIALGDATEVIANAGELVNVLKEWHHAQAPD